MNTLAVVITLIVIVTLDRKHQCSSYCYGLTTPCIGVARALGLRQWTEDETW